MKKILAGLLALTITATLAGCSGASNANTIESGSETAETAAMAAAPQISDYTNITLSDNNTTAADGVTVSGNTITVTGGGAYKFSGSLSDGQIIVAAKAEENVTLMLDGVNITDKTGYAPIFVTSANSVTITSSGENVLSDEGGFFGDDNSDTAAIWSYADITLSGTGTLALSTSGKGIHSEKSITIDGGKINITESDEGIEASLININGGDISLTSSDDGINVSDGSYTADTLYINGGTVRVNAEGDGIDSNGSIVMTGGTVYVDGPTGQDNGALDFDKTFTIDGGTLVAVGSAGMAATPSSGSQSFISALASGKAGAAITVKNKDGKEILSFSPAKKFASVIISSPDIVKGETYTVSVDGVEAATAVAGESGRGGFGGGFAPPSGEFTPPEGGFAPPDGEFAPPSGEFAPPAPPSGEFAPPGGTPPAQTE